MRIKTYGWTYYSSPYDAPGKTDSSMLGYIYVLEIKLTHGQTLLKIGKSQNPRNRLRHYYNKDTCFYLSPLIYDYGQAELILHDFFKNYRVPARPGAADTGQPELFNISLKYFFQYIPVIGLECQKTFNPRHRPKYAGD